MRSIKQHRQTLSSWQDLGDQRERGIPNRAIARFWLRPRRSTTPIVLCFLSFATVVIATQCVSGAEGSDKKRPNFVIFYVDDLGWADTSVRMMDNEPLSASDFYQTPALERLAKQGVRFTAGYAPTPTCTGSRISIQFGMTPARLQYRNVFDVLSKKQRSQKGWDEEVSMAGVLKAANKGYVTAHFGKGMNVRRMDHAGYDVTDEFDQASNGNGHGRYIDVKKRIPIPDDNPLSTAKIALGRQLFFDPRLSADRSTSCATRRRAPSPTDGTPPFLGP